MRVLFADDDAIARTLMSAVLADLQHEATIVEDGVTAWESFQRDPVPLVVLDINMPGLDGLDVCRRIRALPDGDRPFVLIVTARDGRDDLVTVLEAGADDYVTKPASPENLRARLEIAKTRIANNDERRAVQAELERSKWLAGIGETTIAIEHEINNPLSALLGHAELLMMDAQDHPDMQPQIRIIQEQAGRIAEVVRRLGHLKNPRSVEYLAGSRMIDLSGKEKRDSRT